MITKVTIVDQILVQADGSMLIRIGTKLLEDEVEINNYWHRTVVEPSTEVADQMMVVNKHLIELGRPAVSDADIARMDRVKKALS